jgi:hypothetical protein
MATAQTAAPVSQQVETIVESAITLGTSLVRLSATVMVIPLSALPPKARQDTIQAAHKVLTAVDRVHLSVFKTASRVASTWLGELDKAISAVAPPPEATAQQIIIDAATTEK